jgi:stage II sporulation protein D
MPGLIPLFAWILIVLTPGIGRTETIRVLLKEDARSLRLTSNKPFFAQTISGELAAPATYAKADISAMQNGVAINQTDTGEKTVIFTPQRGGRISMNGALYSGDLWVTKKKGTLSVVNEIDIEQYLQGVVPSEMPQDWPMEALRTQAVISRTYALYQKGKSSGAEYDLVSTVLGQVYKGDSVRHPRAEAAIADTEGIVATYDGDLAVTFFHSTSAGPTEDAEEQWGIDQPYLKGVSCPLDQGSPYYTWKKNIPRSDIEKIIARIGARHLFGIAPLAYTKAGRVLTVRLTHEQGETTLKAEELRKWLGYRNLPSTQFTIDSFGKTVTFSGMGWGHGIGLCQWGAKVMAEKGFTFDEIISYYYPGIELEER